MKEKNELKADMWDILKLWLPGQSYGYTESVEATCKRLKEEIEKVENPYPWATDEHIAYACIRDGFEECRQAILKMLEG